MITLSGQAGDRLSHLLRLWREELRVHGANGTGRSTLTQKKVDRLAARIERLHRSIERLNVEYRHILDS